MYWDAVSALSNLIIFTIMDYQGLTYKPLFSAVATRRGKVPDACFPLPSWEQVCGQPLASMHLFTTDACFPGAHITVWLISQTYCGYILGCVLSLLFLPLDVAFTQEL